MRKLLLLLSILCVATSFSQTTEKEKDLRTATNDTTQGWKTGGVLNINFSQTSLNNWAAGGQSNITVNGLLSTFARYKKGNGVWDNYFDIGYGVFKQGKNKTWWKADDKIELTSKYGKKAFKKWYYAALLNFKSQMAPGYNYPNDSIKISDLLAPGYLLGAMGLDFKPRDNFSLFLAPVTAKVTFVKDQDLADAGAFGVEKAQYNPTTGARDKKGLTVRKEFGGYLRASWKTEVLKNVTLQTRIDLFSNYLNNPLNIDVNWETLITMKVNKYITASITTTIIYDDDIDIAVDNNDDGTPDAMGPRTQFKEVLAIGFAYKF